jgi:hypothetical protein
MYDLQKGHIGYLVKTNCHIEMAAPIRRLSVWVRWVIIVRTVSVEIGKESDTAFWRHYNMIS